MSEYAVELQQVTKVFPARRKGRQAVTAVQSVDLQIAPGEFFTLLGASGCGKTTTLRLIAGFLEPNAGKVLLKGKDITG
ncbi:MAG: ATP-binding cassette domain-containing protein, partial [Anaerolineales bacterium]|nr:ATP-binding cassette domain-containing protein [Anaerolineales bacterium]